MLRLRRWGIMAVVSLLVLGTMGAALASEPVDGDTAEDVVEQGFDSWVTEVFEFVLYWGFDDPVEVEVEVEVCGESDVPAVPSGGFFGGFEPADETPVYCLDVAGPKGQVNHGSFVSSFVQWLKEVDTETLPAEWEDLPRGQLIKKAAGHDFGKGKNEAENEEIGPEVEGRGGPPDRVEAKKDAKAEAKAEKRKNK